MIDGRNDSQVIFYDQLIPGSTLLGYLNADHWAVAVAIARGAHHGRVDVRDPERLSPRGADRSGAALRRRGSCRARRVARPMPKPIRPHALATALAAAGLMAFAVPAQAWVYPEHRDIAVLAVEKLDPERKAQFDRPGAKREPATSSACARKAADSQQGVAPDCIDWAAFRPLPATTRARAAACSTARSTPTGSSRSPTWRRS